ncbi:hypothetical protein F5887DRAFT_178051 [Amanita rubescens]|nr:hypothetical protein F5887DRAFT_178051 [Amanita rubescens]
MLLIVAQPVGELPDLEKQHARSVQQGKDAVAPSSGAKIPLFKHEQEKRPVMNGRPAENHGLPVHLFHPVFSLFQRTLADPDIDLSSDDYAIAHTYMSASAAIYETESLRYDAASLCLAKATQLMISNSANSDRTSAGGSFLAPTSYFLNAIAGFYELKNELGAGSSDPTVQGSLLYRKVWVSSELDSIRNSCCCPSFILSVAGPWMCISGAIFIENVVVQQLTDYVWTGGNPYDDKALESVARLFKALSVGLENLKTFYRELKIATKPDLQRMFPFTRFYPDSLGQQVNFDYCKRLSTTKPVYLAKSTSDNNQLIVKYVQRYNSNAHRLLASHGLAPQLHYSSLDDPNSKTMGALGVVVMDYVGETDAYQLYPRGLLPKAVYEEVERAIPYPSLRVDRFCRPSTAQHCNHQGRQTNAR